MRDIAVVANILNCSASEFTAYSYQKVRSRIMHQQIIAEYHGFQAFDKAAKAMIQHEIDLMSSYYLRPRLIFDRCDDTMIQRRIRLPQSTKPAKARECVADFHVIAELYEKLSDTIDILRLWQMGIRYYAGSVMRSQILQIR